jgi:hypothetical protein
VCRSNIFLSCPCIKMLMNVREKRTVLNKQGARIILDRFSVFVNLDTAAMGNTAMVRLLGHPTRVKISQLFNKMCSHCLGS